MSVENYNHLAGACEVAGRGVVPVKQRGLVISDAAHRAASHAATEVFQRNASTECGGSVQEYASVGLVAGSYLVLAAELRRLAGQVESALGKVPQASEERDQSAYEYWRGYRAAANEVIDVLNTVAHEYDPQGGDL